MKIERDWIRAHIPHQGTMCLLDAVERWDPETIVSVASSHRALNNPLRNADGLPITAGVEYAAQSMAVHGALLAGDDAKPAVGFLTHVRNVQWHWRWLDQVETPLQMTATRVSANVNSLLYDFQIHGQGMLLMSGRVGVLTQAPASAQTPVRL